MINKRRLSAIPKYALAGLSICLLLQVASLISPLPSPLTLASDIVALFCSGIWRHLLLSLSRVLISLGIAAIVGTFLGVIGFRIPSWNFFFSTIILPIIESLPPLAWTVVCVLLFGIGHINVIFIVVIILIQFFAVNVLQGIANVEDRYVEMARTYTDDTARLFRYVEAPMISPFFLSALRISYGVAWQVIVLAEMFGASNGLGYLVNEAYYALSINRVISLSAIIVIVFSLTDWLVISIVERTLKAWQT